MGKILFAWELGGGSGHLGPFQRICQRLIELGHEIVLAVRDPGRARQMLSQLHCQIVSAPVLPKGFEIVNRNPITYPMIVQNVGFGDVDCCQTILNAWQTIYSIHQPDLVLADHSPGAIFAGLDAIPHITAIGNGFFIPPSSCPMPNFFGHDTDCPQLISSSLQSEDAVLTSINRWREASTLTSLRSIGNAFGRLNEKFLTTFAEMDHYADRQPQSYLGALQYDSPQPVRYDWPAGKGPRVFAYLKRSPGLGHLFNRIRDLGVPAIVVMDKMDVTQLNRLATANLRFYDQPLPIAQVARECDFAILNATHGATCAFLQAGRPLVQLPQNYEQSITALRTFQLGAGIVANPNSGEQVDQAFLTMLSDHNKFSGAAKFAEKYGDRDSGATATRIAQRIDQLLAQSSSRRLKK